MSYRYNAAARYPMIEYLLVSTLIGLMVVAVVSALGMNYEDAFKAIGNSMWNDLCAIGSSIREAF